MTNVLIRVIQWLQKKDTAKLKVDQVTQELRGFFPYMNVSLTVDKGEETVEGILFAS